VWRTRQPAEYRNRPRGGGRDSSRACHSVAGADAEVEQSGGQAARAVGEVGEGVAVERLVRAARDDFTTAEQRLGARKMVDSVSG